MPNSKVKLPSNFLPNPTSTISVSESKINEIIYKGAQTPEDDDKKDRIFTLRLSKKAVEEIEKIRKKNHYNFSRNAWIAQAVLEKLERDKDNSITNF